MKLVILGVLLASASPSSPPQQFDLICTGEWRFSASEPYERHDFRLRVDLEAGRYCESECKVTRPIAEVQPNVIIFTAQTDQEKIAGKIVSHSIDRSTGQFTYFTAYRNSFRDFIDQKAICTPAAFSGFPQLETKF